MENPYAWTTVANLLALSTEIPAAHSSWPSCNVTKLYGKQLTIEDSRVVVPSIVFALWGFSDSQVQGYSYWLIRQQYQDGAALSRAVGFYKMVQSLGWSIGFVLVPASRVPPLVQLILTAIFALAGAALATLKLPPPPTRKQQLDTEGTLRNHTERLLT